MSDKDSGDRSNHSPTIEDYTDFYELLGVDENASEDEILKNSRKLLGKYHPDVSDQPNADELFRTINRAQDILTDNEQRAIYNSLGHEEYIKRREEGGEMSLSEDIGGSKEFSAATSQGGTEDSSSEPDISTDYGSTNRNERNTWLGETLKEHGSYKSITEVDMGLTPGESIRKMYREIWLARTVFFIVFSAGLLHFIVDDPQAVMAAWESLGAASEYGVNAVIISISTVFAVFVTSVSGLIAYKLLRPVEDEVTIKTEDEKEKHKRDKDRSRGLNTSVGGGPAGSQQSDESRNSWDVHSRYDTARENRGVVQTDGKGRRNWSLKQGSRVLLLGLLMTAIGAFANGVHPWMYLQSLLSGGGVEASLWWDVGTEESRDVVVLLNVAYAFTMVVLTVLGGLSTAHGLSREVWYERYFTKNCTLPFAWDAVIAMFGMIAITGIALGTGEITNLPVSDVPTVVLTYLGASEQFTTVSAGLVGVTGLFLLTILFKVVRRS